MTPCCAAQKNAVSGQDSGIIAGLIAALVSGRHAFLVAGLGTMACGDELRREYLRDRHSGDRRLIGSTTGSYSLALRVFASAGAGLFLGSVGVR